MAARSVLISGTSTGIGAACVGRLVGAGWTVYAGVRRSEDGERLVSELAGDIRPVLLDITDGKEITEAITRIGDEVGGLAGLVNNAGIARGGPVELVSEDDWRLQFEVNFFGTLALTREAFGLVREHSGRFVFMGSMAGRLSAPLLAPYSATKHALEAVAESMRHELASSGIKVSLVEPGEVQSAIWDKADDTIDQIEAMFDADSAENYGYHLDMVRGFALEGRKRGIDADKVAKTVEHALTAKRPKARYLVGPDAKITGVLTRLPDVVRDGGARLNFGRWQRAGRASV